VRVSHCYRCTASVPSHYEAFSLYLLHGRLAACPDPDASGLEVIERHVCALCVRETLSASLDGRVRP
jgi:hypothetical protein